MIYRSLITLALLALLVSTASAQRLSTATRLEVQAAAAFTDGFLVECPPALQSPEFEWTCVNTASTGWSADQLRDWSDYGLGAWTIWEAWRYQEDGYWSLVLMHAARSELLMVSVMQNGLMVIYAGMAIP